MNQEVKSEWVKALRSGEYEQGIGRLRDLNDKFCCLGVLCELAVKKGVIPKPVKKRNGWVYGGPGYENDISLPLTVASWVGLFSPNPTLPLTGRSLAYLNDNGYIFSEIADLIEAEL